MKIVDPSETFEKLGGDGGTWPAFIPAPATTPGGLTYFKTPGVMLLAKPEFAPDQLDMFLEQFPEELGFDEYNDDAPISSALGESEGAALIKTAGQLCYMSFGPNRTKNAEAQKYIDNILASGHGSVLEHAQYSFLVWGADRAFTHELVRHRTGVAFSQVSQRFVDGKVLRFVERPEYQNDEYLHRTFETRVDSLAEEYSQIAAYLVDKQLKGDVQLSGEKRTELRKKVNQAARSCLPNETEAPIIMSGNIRALRHVCEMRASGAADVPIRLVTTRLFLAMHRVEPLLFNDYELQEMPDGTHGVQTKWRKV